MPTGNELHPTVHLSHGAAMSYVSHTLPKDVIYPTHGPGMF